MKVYFLEHSYELNEHDVIRALGIYSTKEKAEKAMENYKKLPRFKDFLDGFNIDEYEINKKCWSEGFFTVYY